MKNKCAVAWTGFKKTSVITNQYTLDKTVLLSSPAFKRYPYVSTLQFNGTQKKRKYKYSDTYYQKTHLTRLRDQ